jgi:hypothetical protein
MNNDRWAHRNQTVIMIHRGKLSTNIPPLTGFEPTTAPTVRPHIMKVDGFIDLNITQSMNKRMYVYVMFKVRDK